jgi:hypothetical protein
MLSMVFYFSFMDPDVRLTFRRQFMQLPSQCSHFEVSHSGQDRAHLHANESG